MFVRALGLMLGTNGVVGAQFPEFKGCLDVLMDAASHLDQAAKRTLGIRCTRVEQEPVAYAGQGVDALANRAGRVAALQGHRRN